MDQQGLYWLVWIQLMGMFCQHITKNLMISKVLFAK